MNRAGVAAAVVAVGAVAGCGKTKTVTVTRTVTVNAAAKSGVGAPEEQVLYGYIRVLRQAPVSSNFILRFDPASFLTGVAANDAAAADGVVSKGEPVPNDNYVVNDSKRAFTYNVDPKARVTILTNGPTGTPSTVGKLAAIVNGRSTTKLWEPLSTGFWIRVDIDTVKSFDQQYHP